MGVINILNSSVVFVATFGGRRKEDDDDDDEGSRSAASSGDAQSKPDPVPKRFGNETRRALTASVACLAEAPGVRDELVQFRE